MQLRRNERWNRRTVANPDAGDVPAENIVLPLIDVVMAGVARSFNRAHFECANADNFRVLQDSDALSGMGAIRPHSFSMSSPKMRVAEATTFVGSIRCGAPRG